MAEHAVRPVANTVNGPVPVEELGIVAIHDALLSVLPGAQYAPDIVIDRAEVFGVLAAKLTAFREAGGGTIVDSTGMFHGRDLPLYEALSTATGVHLIASTGQGPEELLGGYFLTPQTNPPTPWPAEKFAALFTKEVTEGMVVPRLERRAAAGLIMTAADRDGMTATEESLFRGAARAAMATGVPLSIRFGADAAADLEVVLSEGLPANRVLVAGLDRVEAVAAGAPQAVARRGAYVCFDGIGRTEASGGPGGASDHGINDERRAALVAQLVQAGHADRLLLASGSIGVAKGIDPNDTPYEAVLVQFAARLRAAGVEEQALDQILRANPQHFLTVQGAK